MNRHDIEVVVLNYEPDAEVWMTSMAGVGMSDIHRGSEGVGAVFAEIDDVFEELAMDRPRHSRCGLRPRHPSRPRRLWPKQRNGRLP